MTKKVLFRLAIVIMLAQPSLVVPHLRELALKQIITYPDGFTLFEECRLDSKSDSNSIRHSIDSVKALESHCEKLALDDNVDSVVDSLGRYLVSSLSNISTNGPGIETRLRKELSNISGIALIRIAHLNSATGSRVAHFLMKFLNLAHESIANAGSPSLQILLGFTEIDMHLINHSFEDNLIPTIRLLCMIMNQLTEMFLALPSHYQSEASSDASVSLKHSDMGPSPVDSVEATLISLLKFLCRCVSIHITGCNRGQAPEELILDRSIALRPMTNAINDDILNTFVTLNKRNIMDETQALAAILYSAVFIVKGEVPSSLIVWYNDSLKLLYEQIPETLNLIIDGLGFLAARSLDNEQDALSLLKTMLFVAPHNGEAENPYAIKSASALCVLLANYSPDSIMSTTYQFLNLLGANSKMSDVSSFTQRTLNESESARNSLTNGTNTEAHQRTVLNSIDALVTIAKKTDEEKMYGLIISVLCQRLGRSTSLVDAKLIHAASSLAPSANEKQFMEMTKFLQWQYSRALNDTFLSDALSDCYDRIARNPSLDSELETLFITSLLTNIVELDPSSTSMSRSEGLKKGADRQSYIDRLMISFRPLSVVLGRKSDMISPNNLELTNLFRNAWFNIVMGGCHFGSKAAEAHADVIRKVARKCPPLMLENVTNDFESDLKLNTVLRRKHLHEEKSSIGIGLISHYSKSTNLIRNLSYAEVVFMSAVALVENARARDFNCSTVLTYMMDASIRKSSVIGAISSIAETNASDFANSINLGRTFIENKERILSDLCNLVSLCAHRIKDVQKQAVIMANIIFTRVPALLCSPDTVFVLLETLTLLWQGVLEQQTNEYSPSREFSSSRVDLTIVLPDGFERRTEIMKQLYEYGKNWLKLSVSSAPSALQGALQAYLGFDDSIYDHEIALGYSLAMEIGRTIPVKGITNTSAVKYLQQGIQVDATSAFLGDFAVRQLYSTAEQQNRPDTVAKSKPGDYLQPLTKFENKALDDATISNLTELQQRVQTGKKVPISETRELLRRSTGMIFRRRLEGPQIVRKIVSIPFAIFTTASIKLGISLWTWIMSEVPELQAHVVSEISQNWSTTIEKRQGFFSKVYESRNPFSKPMEYAPTDKIANRKVGSVVSDCLMPHLMVLDMLRGWFQVCSKLLPQVSQILATLVVKSLRAVVQDQTCSHILAREIHFRLIKFGLEMLTSLVYLKRRFEIRNLIINAGLLWFRNGPVCAYGANKVQMDVETELLHGVEADLEILSRRHNNNLTQLLLILLNDEIYRLQCWRSTADTKGYSSVGLENTPNLSAMISDAWNVDPAIVIKLTIRFHAPIIQNLVRGLLISRPKDALHVPEGASILLGDRVQNDVAQAKQYLMFWKPVVPLTATTYFLDEFANDPFVTQYAMHSLESSPVGVTFFYVPQIVQALRYDRKGYVQRFIVETGKISQTFAHQIIWNMKANSFKDEDATQPDELKPLLDKVTAKMIQSFSGEDSKFYEREFAFFNEVTSISGKLRPYIKKSKPEKKAKIDEEMAKIKLDKGVYLPSNPDGVVVGIDRKAGKPLQSHAKAPFMATFFIRKFKPRNDQIPDEVQNGESEKPRETIDLKQSAIFKVGDDCRQDVLALQLIAMFRNIFNSVGVDLYLFPYRVTATAPGCGVIDVLPNSISRDMLGREAVNGLYDYFITKFGDEDSEKFQEARAEFAQSMAAYSVVTYLLQFKDRHNGNIMIDDKGHILHIDFGFCFDIAPGGITFESAPFKLTSEMIRVMGGASHQSFKQFQTLCAKAFLACRPYADLICQSVRLMLDSGLPCFKGLTTIHNLRRRFRLDLNDYEACKFALSLISSSFDNRRTVMYDQFQKVTNGITVKHLSQEPSNIPRHTILA